MPFDTWTIDEVYACVGWSWPVYDIPKYHIQMLSETYLSFGFLLSRIMYLITVLVWPSAQCYDSLWRCE